MVERTLVESLKGVVDMDIPETERMSWEGIRYKQRYLQSRGLT